MTFSSFTLSSGGRLRLRSIISHIAKFVRLLNRWTPSEEQKNPIPVRSAIKLSTVRGSQDLIPEKALIYSSQLLRASLFIECSTFKSNDIIVIRSHMLSTPGQ